MGRGEGGRARWKYLVEEDCSGSEVGEGRAWEYLRPRAPLGTRISMLAWGMGLIIIKQFYIQLKIRIRFRHSKSVCHRTEMVKRSLLLLIISVNYFHYQVEQ